ncbi:MAG: Tol-Pal system beta propeller repeat protein TolB [Nitrococcus mobilis]|nr:Tol-Pal system beta propeller repeat protein TolB [Nitrococcus mobilis]
MKLMRRLVVGLLMLLVATQVPAQLTIQITGGAEGALPIALIPFRVENGAADPPEEIITIIRDDLYRTGLLQPLSRKDLIAQPATLEEVRFQNWRALGVDNLVVGALASDPDGGYHGYQVSFELLDVYTASRLVGKRYRVQPTALRTLGHTISDTIFQSLFGRPGGFNTQIAYVEIERNAGQTVHKLVVADADGYNPQIILTSNAPIMSPAWSPDRQRIGYVSFENGRSEVYVQEVASGKRRTVASFDGINSAPAWSPQGNRLALTLSKDGNPEIYVLDLASANLRQITHNSSIDTEPVWTPNGQQIIFTSDRGGSPQIYRLPSAGGEAERLTFEGNYNARPALSPDGRLLALVHREDGKFKIAVLDLQTRLTRVLTDGPLDESPSFAPNGATLLYSSVRGGKSELATVSIYGRAHKRLGAFSNAVQEPTWSPL